MTVSLAYEPSGASQPVHIHVGSCPNPGDVRYPLTDVVNGRSETTLNVPYADLVSLATNMPLAINAHVSATNIGTYVSCGDIYP